MLHGLVRKKCVFICFLLDLDKFFTLKNANIFVFSSLNQNFALILSPMKEYQYHIFSPYRVCPLGAHVDHQHGLVTGFAIDKGVHLWWSPAKDGHVELES